MSIVTPCPNIDVLELFVCGRLSETDHARCELHVLNCRACQDRLAALDDHHDEFEDLIESVPEQGSSLDRSGRSSGHTPRGARSDSTVHDSMSLVPEVLGDFKIIREIGRGGMGIVYEAVQIGLNRRVALKMLPFVNLLEPNRLKRFQNESRAAASLDHPNIVPVIAVGEDRQIYFYAMRYVNGPNLSQILQLLNETTAYVKLDDDESGKPVETPRSRPGCQTTVAFGVQARPRPARTGSTPEETMDFVHQVRIDGSVERAAHPLAQHFTKFDPRSSEYFRHIAQIGVQTAKALAFAHENGVVHRDVKPSNLMCDEQGKLWITDFGLARVESQAVSTVGRPIQGTPRYMSPEQSIGQRGVVDHRTDVYSLGVTLYELLTLTPIFPEAAVEELPTRIQRDEPRAPRLINPRIPRDLETIVLSAMSKEPRDRYNTASDFADDLTCFLEHKPIKARRPTIRERVAKWVRRHPSSLSVAAGFAVVVLAATAGLLIYSSRLDQANQDLKNTRAELEDALTAAQASELRARRQIYSQDLRQASLALNEFDAKQAFDLLQAHVPEENEVDLRGFEWDLLLNRCIGKGFTIPVSEKKRPLYDVRFSPDDRYITVTGEEPIVHVWNASNWTLEKSFATDQIEINAAAISPDGKTLATSGDDGSIRLIDFPGGGQRVRIEAHRPKSFNLVYTADGKQLISTGEDKQIRVWNSQTGADEGRFEGHTAAISHLTLSHDGQFLVSSSADETVRLWKIADHKEVKSLIPGKIGLATVAISPDNTLIACAGSDNSLHLANVQTGKSARLATLRDTAQYILFLDGGKRLAASDRGGTLHLFELGSPTATASDLPAGKELVAWQCHQDRSQCLAVAPDGGTILSAGWNGMLRVLDLRHVNDDGRIPVPLHGRPTAFQFNENEELIYCDSAPVGNAPQCVRTIHPVSGVERKFENRTEWPLTCAALSPDGTTAYFGHPAGKVTVHRADGAGNPVVWDLASPADVTQIVATPDGKLVIVGIERDKSDSVRVFEVPSGKRRDYPVNDGHSIVLSPDGHTLGFSFARDAFLWDLSKKGGNQRRIPGRVTIRRLAFSNDGQHFAIGGEERTIEIRDLAEPTVAVTKMTGHAAEVCMLAFSHDGRTLVSGDDGGAIKFWHVPSGRHLLDLAELGETNVNTIEVSPGGRFLAYSHNRTEGDSIVVYDLEKLHADASSGIEP